MLTHFKQGFFLGSFYPPPNQFYSYVFNGLKTELHPLSPLENFFFLGYNEHILKKNCLCYYCLFFII
jgi:hypothetical protein